MFEIVGILSTFILLCLITIWILAILLYGSSDNYNKSLFSKGTGSKEKFIGILLIVFNYTLWYLFFS